MITNQVMGDGAVVHIGVLQKGNKYLIGKRKSFREFPNTMEFPGGKQERYEHGWQTLYRELKEELGIRIENMDSLMAVCYKKYRLFFYLVTKWDTEPQPLDHTELLWQTRNEIIERTDLINEPMKWICHLLAEYET